MESNDKQEKEQGQNAEEELRDADSENSRRKVTLYFQRVMSLKTSDQQSPSNFFLSLTEELVRELQTESSFASLIKVSRIMRELKTRMATDAAAQAVQLTFHKKLSKVKEKKFSWEVDCLKFKMLTPLFGLTDAFDHWAEFSFVDPEGLVNGLLSFDNLQHLFQLDYFLGHDDPALDHLIQDFHCSISWAFLKLYVSFPCADFPVLDDHQLALSDPLSRQKVRLHNQKRYRETTQTPHGFELAEQIVHMIRLFVLLQPLKWNAVPNRNSVLPILHLMHQSLVFGLIRQSDCETLMVHLEHTTEVLIHLERSLRSEIKGAKHRKSHMLVQTGGPKSKQSSYHELVECRVLVSRILLQVVCVWNDSHCASLMQKGTGADSSVLKEPTEGALWNCQSLLRNISLVYLNYLCSRTFHTAQQRLSQELLLNSHRILVFLTNHKDNFFVNGLTLVHREALDSYVRGSLDSPSSHAAGLLQKALEFASRVRDSQPGTSVADLVLSFRAVCTSVASTLTDDPGLTLSLELSWSGFTLFFLRNLVKLQLETGDMGLLAEGCRALGMLTRHNHHSQGLLFGGSGLKAFSDLMDNHPSHALWLLLESFGRDWTLFHMSGVLFDLVVDHYDRLMAHVKALLVRDSGNDNDLRVVQTLLDFNAFLLSLLLSPGSSAEHVDTHYDIVIQRRVVVVVAEHVVQWLGDSTHHGHVAQAVLQSRRTVAMPSHPNSSASTRLSLHSAMPHLAHSLLELFNQSTSVVFTKSVADRVSATLSNTDWSAFPFASQSGLALRTQLVRLFSHFVVFPSNHLVFEEIDSSPSLDLDRQFIPDNVERVHSFVREELLWWSRDSELTTEVSCEEDRARLQDYLFGALLPTLVKYFKGLQSTLTILERPDTIEGLLEFSSAVTGLLKARVGVLDDLDGLRFGEDRGSWAQGKEVEQSGSKRSLGGSGSQRVLEGAERESGQETSERRLAQRGKSSERELMKKLTSVRPKSRSDWDLRNRMGGSRVNRRGAQKVSLEQLITDEGEDRPGEDKDGGGVGSQEKERRAFGEGGRKSQPSFIESEVHFVGSTRVERKEELSEAAMGGIRRHCKDILERLGEAYQRRPQFAHHLAVFQRVPVKDSSSTSFLTEALSGGTTPSVPDSLSTVLKALSSCPFETRPEKNAFLRLLTVDSHRDRYNFELAYLSVTVLSNASCRNDPSDYKRSFLAKHLYFQHIDCLISLLTHSPQLRVQTFEILARAQTGGDKPWMFTKEGVPVATAFFRHLWATSVSLTLFLFYKPFEDAAYSRFHRMSQLLSRLFKGFFGHNYPKLRQMMSSSPLGVFSKRFSSLEQMDNALSAQTVPLRSAHTAAARSSFKKTKALTLHSAKQVGFKSAPVANSIFYEKFVLAVYLFRQSSIWRHQDKELMPSDRPPLFYVLAEVLSDVTGFVQGPSLENQLQVFDKGTFIWTGILNRVVEDIDSDFYKVKLATLLYVNGLLQGFNEEVVSYMHYQLRVQRFHQGMLEMVRLVYRQLSAKASAETEEEQAVLDMHEQLRLDRQAAFRNYDHTDHFQSLLKQANRDSLIRSADQLVETYKNDPRFDSHQVVGVVVATFVLMKTLATKIREWQDFISEKEIQARLSSSKERFATEDNVIFDFVMRIIFSVEVVYVVSETEVKRRHLSTVNETLISVNKDSLAEDNSARGSAGGSKASQSRPPTEVSKFSQMRGESSRRSNGTPVEDSLKGEALVGGEEGLDYTQKINQEESSGKSGESLDHSGTLTFDEAREDMLKSSVSKRVQQRFYFLRPPESFFVTDLVKENLLRKMPIKNTTKRQLFLYNSLYAIVHRAEKLKYRHSKVRWLSQLVTPDSFRKYEIVMGVLGWVMNVLMLSFLRNREVDTDPTDRPQPNFVVLEIFGYIIIGFASLFWVMWLLFEWPANAQSKIKKFEIQKERSLSLVESIRIYILDSLLLNNNFNTFLLYFIIAVLGSAINFWFYTLQVVLIVKVYKEYNDILRAVTLNYTSILSTLTIMVLFLYFYGFVIMIGLDDAMLEETRGGQSCRTLFTCVINTWNFGLRETGGIGVFFFLLSEPNIARFWLMWLVSTTFFMIVKLAVLSMTGGAIINGFEMAREDRVSKEYDRNNHCLICGMDQWASVKQGLSFHKHINETHNVWNYLSFLIKLIKTGSSELSGFEYEVFSQYELGKTEWFPKNKFLKSEENYIELEDKSGKSESDGDDSDDDDSDDD